MHFINYMNILDDFRLKLHKETDKKDKANPQAGTKQKQSIISSL